MVETILAADCVYTDSDFTPLEDYGTDHIDDPL
jgi:hypothetical protein